MRSEYRIWDKHSECFYSPTYEAYNGTVEELFVCRSGGLVMRLMENHKESMVHESLFPNRFVVCWFTGMHDKDGKKIYEGDTLKDSLGNFRPVEWSDNFGAYRVRHHGEYLHSIARDSTVVGNVYERPDLL